MKNNNNSIFSSPFPGFGLYILQIPIRINRFLLVSPVILTTIPLDLCIRETGKGSFSLCIAGEGKSVGAPEIKQVKAEVYCPPGSDSSS
jgi:hypothetical protein